MRREAVYHRPQLVDRACPDETRLSNWGCQLHTSPYASHREILGGASWALIGRVGATLALRLWWDEAASETLQAVRRLVGDVVVVRGLMVSVPGA
jgi:hypothetical protein